MGGDGRLGLALEPPPLLTTGRHMPHRSETSGFVAAFASTAALREKPAGKPARSRRPASWGIVLVFIGGMGLSSAEGRAQTIVAPSARTLFNRATLIRSSVEIRHSSLRMEGGSVGVTQYVPAVTVVYGFSPGWMVILAQPYAIVDATHRMGGEAERERVSGLADTRVFVQYGGLYSRNAPGGMTRLSAVFGVQVPTGADRFSTGAVAYTGGLVFQKAVRLKHVFSGDFEYTRATENRQGMSMGDRLRFDAALSRFVISSGDVPAGARAGWPRRALDRLFRHGAYLVVEMNGTWQARARRRGEAVPDTGGTTLSVSPGIQYFLSDRFLVEFSAPIPVVRALNGRQPEPRSTFLLGFRFLF